MTGSSNVLVVEDEWMIAEDIAEAVVKGGCRVVGPVATVEGALMLIEAEPIDAALLDISLASEHSYPIAESLRSRGIPFAFLTGYDERDIKPPFHGVACLTKPLASGAISSLLARLLEQKMSNVRR